MAKSLSEDLRSRLIAAEDGGMSRRAASDRFGVAVATSIRWVRAWRHDGSVCVKPRGGDLGSHRVEAYRASILAAIDAGGHHTDGAGRYAPRAAWRVVCAQRLAFIDETGASTKMARRDGRARRGPRCRAPIPDGHWQTTTFTGALRLGGMTAPMVLDGPMNGVAFQADVGLVLVPTLALAASS